MLVVTSNWGLTDGTLAGGAAGAPVDRLRAEVRRAAWRCGMRRDGRYRPIEAVDLLLAGDTFDWLSSREWTGAVKPWQAGPRAAAARERVVEASARRGCRLRATLAGWARRGIAVPAADRRGRPVPAAQVRVPVRVTALRGDRDRWLDRLPAAATRLLPGAAVGISWSDDGVTVLHGDALDPLHEACDCEPSLGESLAVDLIATFGAALDGLPAVRSRAATLVRMLGTGAVIDAPQRLVAWLADDEGGGCMPVASRRRLAEFWNESVGRWHKEARRLAPAGMGGIDVVGEIAAALEIGVEAERLGRAPCRHVASASRLRERPVGSPAVILGHAFAPGRDCPQGVACLAAGAEGQSPPLAVIAAEDGARRGGRLEWVGVSGAAQHAAFGDAPAGRSLRGVWLSEGPDAGRPFVDAA
ncbi:MAG: hypothetical protein RLZZ111_1287 [Planctomycetota bacterium]|jgi:hypothetical protein